VTADYPLYAVFRKGSQLTHVAHNVGNQPITVTFSDGTVMQVEAKSFGMKRHKLPQPAPVTGDPGQ
jgi:hypothetical protein